MHLSRTIPFLLAMVTTVAHAHAIDAKALARYDISYVKCESKFPDMRGHRDAAYLNLWRIKPNEKSLAELAAVRKGSVYLSERKRATQAASASAAASTSSALQQQCQGLWAEYQRTPKTKR